MNNFLRKHRAVIVWVVVAAFLVGGGLFGFGMYLGGTRVNGGTQATDTIAKVGKTKITQGEFYDRLAAQGQYDYSGEQLLALKYQVLNSMIEMNLLMDAAKKEKINVEVTDEDINGAIEQLKTQYGLTDEQLQQALASQGGSLESLRSEAESYLHDQKLIEGLMDKVVGDIQVTDEEIRNSYEQVEISTIFIAKGKDAEKAKTKADEAYGKLQAGEDFAAVAKEYSEASNAETGGSLGYINREYFDSQSGLTEAAFGLEVGKTSDVIDTNTGYHILKATNKRLAEGKDFEDQKEALKNDLLQQKQAKAQADWFQSLKDNAKIVINDPEIAAYKALAVDQDTALAIKKFEEITKKNPENSAALYYLANAYQASGDNDKAIETLDKAVENRPENWEYYNSLGQIYQTKQENDKAIEMFTKASANAPTDDISTAYSIHLNLKEAFTQLGRQDLADNETAVINDLIDQYDAEQKQQQELQQQQQQQTDNNGETN